jgi:hypothetical protein
MWVRQQRNVESRGGQRKYMQPQKRIKYFHEHLGKPGYKKGHIIIINPTRAQLLSRKQRALSHSHQFPSSTVFTKIAKPFSFFIFFLFLSPTHKSHTIPKGKKKKKRKETCC